MTRQQYTGIKQVIPDSELAPLDDDQLSELFASGWRFNPSSTTWHKLFVAQHGAAETPDFVTERFKT